VKDVRNLGKRFMSTTIKREHERKKAALVQKRRKKRQRHRFSKAAGPLEEEWKRIGKKSCRAAGLQSIMQRKRN